MEPTLGGPPPGEVLPEGHVLGRCRIERLLGRGGMGAVYLARHLTLDVHVALKVVAGETLRADPAFGERLMREARLAAQLSQHPHVVATLDAARDPVSGQFYVVQEYAAGGSLAQRVERGPLPEREAVLAAIAVAKALVAAAAHGIVHRDIKPDNVLIAADGRVKLADLGLARQLGNSSLTGSQMMLGTPSYMAPEQIDDAARADARADVYALGATLYHLVTGLRPYEGKSVLATLSLVANGAPLDPRDRVPAVSAGVAAVCLRATRRDPAERYQSAAEMLAALKEIQRAEVASGPATDGPRSGSRVAMGRTARPAELAAIGVAAAAILATLAGLTLCGPSREPDDQPSPSPFVSPQPLPANPTVPVPTATVDPRPPVTVPVDPRPDHPPPADPPPERPFVNPPPDGAPADPPPPVTPPVDPPAPSPLARGLELLLDCELTSGQTRDRSGRNRHGRADGQVASAPGRHGAALRFSGGSVDLPGEFAQGTIAAWFRPATWQAGVAYDGGRHEESGRGLVIGLYRPRTPEPIGHWGPMREPSILIGFWRHEIFAPVARAEASEWVHLVVVIGGASAASVYRDGNRLPWIGVGGPRPTPGILAGEVISDPAPTIRLGRSHFDAPGLLPAYTGDLDEIAVWNRPLAAEELTELFARVREQGLVAALARD